MSPIRFACEVPLPQEPAAIAAGILDLDQWPNFRGYGPLPGIREARFETRTPEVAGSRIQVTNRHGSTHVEEIEVWNPPEHVLMRLAEFSPPVSRLASHFLERWDFQPTPVGTRVRRSFELYPRSARTRPILWLVARLLKRAIARHLDQMRLDLERTSK